MGRAGVVVATLVAGAVVSVVDFDPPPHAARATASTATAATGLRFMKERSLGGGLGDDMA
jgi:hypothetical protein